jgi:hypothetical protein
VAAFEGLNKFQNGGRYHGNQGATCYDHLCFSFFYHFGRFHGNDSHFEKNQPLKNNFTWHMIFLQGFITFEKNPHLVERDKPKKLESVRQILTQLPWKQKKGDLIFLGDSFHQTS